MVSAGTDLTKNCNRGQEKGEGPKSTALTKNCNMTREIDGLRRHCPGLALQLQQRTGEERWYQQAWY